MSDDDPKQVNAPWTDEQVESLNGYQVSGVMHPFTGTRKPNGDETILIATKDGWIEREGGPVMQTWAHTFMADGSWRAHVMPLPLLTDEELDKLTPAEKEEIVAAHIRSLPPGEFWKKVREARERNKAAGK